VDDADKIASSPFVIGGLGALVALKGAPGDTWFQRFFNIASGALVAGYFSPWFAEWAALNTTAAKAGCAFFFGLFGMNLVAAVTSMIGKLQLGDVIPWFRKRGD
jgi:hypothetical protein